MKRRQNWGFNQRNLWLRGGVRCCDECGRRQMYQNWEHPDVCLECYNEEVHYEVRKPCPVCTRCMVKESEMKTCKNFNHIFKLLKSPLGVLILTKILKTEDFQEC